MSIPSFKYNPVVGPVESICIFPVEFDHEKDKILPKKNHFQELFGTGSNSVCISPDVVEKLNPIEKREVHGVTSAKKFNFYAFRIGFITGPTPTSSGLYEMTMEYHRQSFAGFGSKTTAEISMF